MKRYVLQAGKTDLEEHFEIPASDTVVENNFNIMAGSKVPIIIEQNGVRKLVKAVWGITGQKSELIDAIPYEEVLKNSFLKKLAQSTPCIIPASGFYKWKETVSDPLPFYLRVLKNEVLAFVGLYSASKSKNGDMDYSFAVLTMPGNALVEPLDPFMPCILDESNYESWLQDGAIEMIERGFSGKSLLPHMAVYRVADLVNDPSNNSQELIQPIPKLRDDDD